MNSDIDLLSLVDGFDPKFDPNTFSIYSYERTKSIWKEGNPFAWHLHLESKILYASDGVDFIKGLGAPSEYKQGNADCEKFREIFKLALANLLAGSNSEVFELSNMFLAIRNFATCYSLQFTEKPEFSRSSALRLKNESLFIKDEVFNVLERSRVLSTRGIGEIVTSAEILMVLDDASRVDEWMRSLLLKSI